MVQRIQSPSSINRYRMCPRCYYYKYKMSLNLLPSIYMVRGKILHSVLEDFFKLDSSTINPNHYEFEFNVILENLLKKKWNDANSELSEVGLNEDKLEFFYDNSLMMIHNWFNNFMDRLVLKTKKIGFNKAFNELKPESEVYFLSEEYKVQGFVDAIHKADGIISVIDYKTSRRDVISDEYKLQLAIYALLYHEKYNKKPDFVGIDFLNHKLKYIKVDDELLEFARRECILIQEKTMSDNIEDYPSSGALFCECKKYVELLSRQTLNDF